MWSHRHLLSIANLSKAEISHLLDTADTLTSAPPPTTRARLQGRTVATLFFEPSTRTKLSFELAAKRLGADVVDLSVASSSTAKGETLVDTARNLEAMGVNAFVLRHSSSGVAQFLADHTSASVLNAGDGTHEHPTQALLDALTIRRRLGTLSGLRVAILGDITHSRVARSNALLLGLFGSEVRLCAPRTLMPKDADTLGATVRVCESPQDAVRDADVVMALRIQKERFADAVLASAKETFQTFGVTRDLLNVAKPHALVMHPGPMNRGVEIASDVADGPQSVILEQVSAGVSVRMAALCLLLERA